MARYRFIRSDNKIVCLSTYAKKVVRGIAKCSPNDKFNLEMGEKLAQLRCDEKIADKRRKRAEDKYFEAVRGLNDARAYFFAMEQYWNNARVQYDEIHNELKRLEREI